MIITNKHGLPEVLDRAAKHDPYSKGDADFSVTELISSPRIAILNREHDHEIEVDITDRIWSLLGTAVHKIIEEASSEDGISEERLYHSINGVVVSGGVDYQNIDGNFIDIIDFKVTSTYAYMSEKIEWEQQLNVYALLSEENKGKKVKSLQICAILRDWKAYEARLDKNYPQVPIVMLDIPIWRKAKRDKYLLDRVRAHMDANVQHEFGGELPQCTESEQWRSEGFWLVEKPNAKRVWRKYSTQDAAKKELTRIGEGSISYRPGEPRRCKGNYCLVNRFCSQWANDPINEGSI